MQKIKRYFFVVAPGGEQNRDTCKGKYDDVCEQRLKLEHSYKDKKKTKSIPGDGGSPLVCHIRDGQYAQVGIVSWGIGCGAIETPAVYTNVPLFRNWIDQQMDLMHYSQSAYYL